MDFADLSSWVVLGLFFLNLVGLADMAQSIERKADHGCLLYGVVCFGLITFIGLPWLLWVGVRETAFKR